MEPLIEVRDLSRHFSSGLFRPRLVRAVDGVSFSVAPGETFGVMGESGCGKSTLARLLARLLPPTAGTIRLDGIDLSAASGEQLRRLRRRIQIIFQDAEGTLDPRMRVRDLVLEPLRVHGLLDEPEPAIDRLLDTVNLTPDLLDRFPHQLSGGQRQRLGVARATCLDPDFIVLDEPAASLDLSIQAQVLANLSQRQRDRGTGYLLITHNLKVLRLLAQRVAVMYLGRFVEVGTAAEIFDHPRHPYTQALISSMGRRTGARRNAAPVGEPPSPLDPPSGCAFHPRCPRAETVCRETPPSLLGDRRLVACHLALEPDARRPAHSSTSDGGPASI